MRSTRVRLADGRELVYYDAGDGRPQRGEPDLRTLADERPAAEVRHDPLLDAPVVVAAHRQGRTFRPGRADCPLCPSRPGHPTEIPAPDYEVAVFENRFPSLGVAGVAGRCEVICFSADHEASFASLGPARVELVLAALTDRSAVLAGVPGVEQVYCFENRGEEIGVTLSHPHGQIYAYPFVTPRTSRMLGSLAAHRDRTGRNLFDDILATERAGPRVVAARDGWTAFVPYAARWPYEVHVYPDRRVPDLPSLTGSERAALAAVYLDVLERFERLFPAGRVPYISAWHQAPVRAPEREAFALHLEVFTVRRAADRIKFLAGSESGMDAFLNDVVPEVAATRLRGETG